MSTFGAEFDHLGDPMHVILKYPTLGISLDDLASKFSAPLPDYIKIDVDGIEHLILKGGRQVLQGVRSLLIEVNDRFEKQSVEVSESLLESGFTLRAKLHAQEFDSSNDFTLTSINQIWERLEIRD
jgi:hypothetical protein